MSNNSIELEIVWLFTAFCFSSVSPIYFSPISFFPTSYLLRVIMLSTCALCSFTIFPVYLKVNEHGANYKNNVAHLTSVFIWKFGIYEFWSNHMEFHTKNMNKRRKKAFRACMSSLIPELVLSIVYDDVSISLLSV